MCEYMVLPLIFCYHLIFLSIPFLGHKKLYIQNKFFSYLGINDIYMLYSLSTKLVLFNILVIWQLSVFVSQIVFTVFLNFLVY